MKLIITQPEIEAIVRAHVESTVQIREGSEMKIDFTATRSDDGITATIDIPYMGLAGIPAIADAVAAVGGSKPTTTDKPPAGPIKRAAKTGLAQSILGGGTSPATETAKNPEPVAAQAEVAMTTTETPQDVVSGDATDDQGDAPAPAAEAAQESTTDATEAAPAPSRGPSLFGQSFLTR